MSEECSFCGGPVNPHDIGIWKLVTGWVHGPKWDSMTLRIYTGYFAHNHCVKKASAGQTADQPDIFEVSTDRTIHTDVKIDSEIEELLDGKKG